MGEPQHNKVYERIKTKEDVERVFKAGKDVISLSTQWYSAILDGDQVIAARFRRDSNRIKREIREKYNIIL
jgi:RNase P protein component